MLAAVPTLEPTLTPAMVAVKVREWNMDLRSVLGGISLLHNYFQYSC